MKRIEFLKEISGLSKEDLHLRANQIAEEMMKLRFRKAAGQLENPRRIGVLRRNLAQVQTVLRSKFQTVGQVN